MINHHSGCIYKKFIYINIIEMSEGLKYRCLTEQGLTLPLSDDNYIKQGDSPSPYCQCIMDGFETPGEDELIFSNIDLTSVESPSELNNVYPGIVTLTVGYTSDGDFHPDILNPYLESLTNLYNTKLNEDSEILSSYIRCKEENYKPIITQFRDNATVITDFVSQNKDSIESILDKIDEFPIESITPIISEVSENITPTISKVNEINSDVSTLKETITDPWIKYPIIISLVIFALFLIINVFFMIKKITTKLY